MEEPPWALRGPGQGQGQEQGSAPAATLRRHVSKVHTGGAGIGYSAFPCRVWRVGKAACTHAATRYNVAPVQQQ